MMSQRKAFNSVFADEPFFGPGRLLWPLHHRALSSLQQDFFNRRAKLADSLLRELHDGHPLLSSTLTGLNGGTERQLELPSTEQQPTENNSDLLVTLDARGYAPSDITVKLEGRRLAVAAMKQAGAEQSQTCASSSACAAFRSSACAQQGFVQKIDLAAHLDLSGLSCSLMDDGQLRIHAPAAKQRAVGEERQVPVRFRSSLEFPITKDNREGEAKN